MKIGAWRLTSAVLASLAILAAVHSSAYSQGAPGSLSKAGRSRRRGTSLCLRERGRGRWARNWHELVPDNPWAKHPQDVVAPYPKSASRRHREV